jgi:hypothetical protein
MMNAKGRAAALFAKVRPIPAVADADRNPDFAEDRWAWRVSLDFPRTVGKAFRQPTREDLR